MTFTPSQKARRLGVDETYINSPDHKGGFDAAFNDGTLDSSTREYLSQHAYWFTGSARMAWFAWVYGINAVSSPLFARFFREIAYDLDIAARLDLDALRTAVRASMSLAEAYARIVDRYEGAIAVPIIEADGYTWRTSVGLYLGTVPEGWVITISAPHPAREESVTSILGAPQWMR